MSETKKLAFDAKDLAFWRTEIKLARQKREDVSAAYGWDDNLKRYVPKPLKNAQGQPTADVNIGADFRDVERKKAALLFEFPQVGLVVKQDRELQPQTPEQQQALQSIGKPLMLSTLIEWQSDLLNTILGPEHANADHAARKALFNCLCPAGVGPVTVGYQVTMTKVKTMTPVVDAMGNPINKPVPAMEQAGAMLGLMASPMPEPMMQEIEVEVPIYEKWFVSDFSPKALLIPASFRDTNFQRAPWLGKDVRKPRSQWIREHKLKPDWNAGRADDTEKPYFENDRTDVSEDDAGDPYVSGVELYYRAELRATEETHPEKLRKLVLVDGMSDPLVHVDCPYQDFTESGELGPASLIGFVDRPLILRDLSDSAWIPSDCAVTSGLTKEGEKYRAQIIEQRNGNKMVIAFDSGKVDPTATDKIKSAHGVTWVAVTEGTLAGGIDAVMKQVAQPTLGRETYMGMDVIDNDREKILGISANQTGTQTKGRRTATENEIVQRNSEARFEQERQRVMAWVVDIATAIDTLILRYGDARIATQILGDVRGGLWAAFKSHLAGAYTYDLRVDSGKYLDIEADRRQIMQFYQMVRKDPLVNPRPILTEIAAKFGFDPAEFIVEPTKPEQQLKASLAVKSEMLDPSLPQFPIIVKLLRQGGWEITEDDVKLAQSQAMANTGGMMPVAGVGPHPNKGGVSIAHPGMQEQQEPLNKHQEIENGQRTGPKISVN